MKKVQMIARMAYRAFTVSMLIFLFDKTAIWALPLGILVGMLSEAEEMSKK